MSSENLLGLLDIAMRLNEVLVILRVWSTEIELRATELKRCATIWSVINYGLRAPILMLSCIATVLMTLSATEESEKGEYAPMAIAAIVVNSMSVFVTGVDTALKAEKCASRCVMCAKQYIELSNEMNLDIDTLSLQMIRENEGDPHSEQHNDLSFNAGHFDAEAIMGEYKFIKAKYISKQQTILNEEPSTLFFRGKLLRKRIMDATSHHDTESLDEHALIALRQRTRKASQWKVQRRPENSEEIPV